MVDVVDLLHPVVLLQRHRVEAAHLADPGEGRLERGEGVGGGAGAHVLVVVEDDEAVAVLDGDDGPREAVVLPRLGGPLLRQGGELVDVAAREAFDGRDQVGADALRREPGLVVRHRVHRPGAAVRAHRHAGHRLDTARQDEVLPARTDFGGGQVDGLQARGAEAVLLDTGDGVGKAGRDRRDACDVGSLVAERADHAEHDVVDGRRVQSGEAVAELVDQADDEVDRLGAVQGPVGLAAAARGADRVVDECFGTQDSCLSRVVAQQGRAGSRTGGGGTGEGTGRAGAGLEGGRGQGSGGQASSERPMISFMISVVPP